MTERADEGVNVVSLVPLTNDLRERIEGVDETVHVTDASGWFDEEGRETWGDHVPGLSSRPDVVVPTRRERDELLADTDVVLVSFPLPVDLRARSPRLRWVHQTTAGASNFRRCDVWGSEVSVTTSRGVGNSRAIAEYTIATFLYFSRDLHLAVSDRAARRFDRDPYLGVVVAGKTVCVVGAGGIGQEVGRLCAALGMRVVGIRRSESAETPVGFAEMRGPDGLLDLLGGADFVAICCQLTTETEGLIGSDALSAMPRGAVIVNVARGGIIDEAALIDALAMDQLRGVALDVYVDEFEQPPPEKLWSDPRVLITPHTSGRSDVPSEGPIDLFCENLRLFVDGRPLRNRIEWQRGY